MIEAAALLLAVAGAADTPPTAPQAVQAFAQVRIRSGVIVRVPARREHKPTKWKEKRGPKCIPASFLAGALPPRGDEVDLLLRGGTRMRAKLEDRCPALDYYNGFYLKPGADGKICEDRDAIHTRSGGKCEIERFRRLVPDE